MTKIKSTKRALLMSALALVLCVSMLVGSTFAWFTDSVVSGNNIIKSGNLKVDLLDATGASLEGKTLKFVAADGTTLLDGSELWEPGCKYNLQPVFVKNAGNLALKYEIVINGINGNAKLLEAIEWSVTVGGTSMDLNDLKGELLADTTSAGIVLTGHMREDAGNEYQGLTAEGISIAVFATQLDSESDSFDNQYDADAQLPTVVLTTTEFENALKSNGDVVLNGTFDSDNVMNPWPAYGSYTSEYFTDKVDTITGGELILNNKLQFGMILTDTQLVSDLKVTTNNSSGIYTESDNRALVMRNVEVVAEGGLGFHIEQASKGVVLENCTVKQNGLIAGYTEWKECAVFAGGGALLTIESGDYQSSGYAIHTGGATRQSIVTVNGGNFVGKINVLGNDKLIIKGGTFSVDPTAYVDTNAYNVTNNGTTWTVTAK